jgi:hypothetical protein
MTREEVLHGVLKALEQGDWTNAGRGALAVAQQRLRQGRLGGPLLDESTPVLGTRERIGLPVDLRQAKQILTPLYERLLREKEIAPASMGGKAQALLALDRMMNGPDVAPASVVDGALSDLKAMARTDIPELRTTGQGIVAQAIKLLEPKLQEAVRRGAGGDARARGRARQHAGEALGPATCCGNSSATMRIARAGDHLSQAHGAEGQRNVSLLRKVQRARAGANAEARRAGISSSSWTRRRREGGFDKAGRLQAEWQRLGPQTKTILFQEPDQRKALDNFFLLAKRIAENPNPSGTAHVNNVFNWFSSIGTYPAAKLLYTPGGAQFLARFMSGRAPATAQQLTAAARAAGLLEVATTAKDDAAR